MGRFTVMCSKCRRLFVVDDPEVRELLLFYGPGEWVCLECKNDTGRS